MDSKLERGGSTLPDILLVTGSLQCGGAERVLSDMASYWAKKGWTVTVVTWGDTGFDDFYELDPGVKRLRLDVDAPGSSKTGKLRYYLPRIFALRRLLSASRPDAVLSFINISNVLTILAATGLKMKVVVSERTVPSADRTISLGWRILRRITYPWSDDIVVQSKDVAKWIRRHCWKTPVVIPNPIRFLPQHEYAREPLIVAVGRLAVVKGFDLLLRAFAEIAAEFGDWNVAIIGEGDELDKLLRLRQELGLSDRVQFVGQAADVETWMARAGLVVQPSRFEGFPNVLLESMSTGAAVISGDCPSGPAEIIEDGVNGRLVPVDDVRALADAMKELMSQPALRDRLGNEARQVAHRFGQESIMPLWEQCLVPDRVTMQHDRSDTGEVSLERRQ